MIRLQVALAVVLGLAALAYFHFTRGYDVALALLMGVSVGALAYTGVATVGRLARLWRPGGSRYEVIHESEENPEGPEDAAGR